MQKSVHLKKNLFLKLSFFCDKHLISFEDNTFSQIFIFHTALTNNNPHGSADQYNDRVAYNIIHWGAGGGGKKQQQLTISHGIQRIDVFVKVNV